MPTQVFVFDWRGDLWRLAEGQPTPHGFHVLRGKPPKGQPGRAEVILTGDLADHLRADPLGRSLPMSQATIARLRAALGLPQPGPPDWPEAQKDRLRALWNEGLSAGVIGRRMGVSRNAVLGQARRMKLAPRGSPIVRGPRGPRLPR